MIEVKNIDKFFDNGTRQILFNVSAKFYDGKTNLIIGQSGSGKTVLVKNIVGLFKPDKGEILYDGRDITRMSAKQMKEIRKEIGKPDAEHQWPIAVYPQPTVIGQLSVEYIAVQIPAHKYREKYASEWQQHVR